MSNSFIWFAPPLLGAFIGYLTNYVAIRMLFRPLRPWSLFGLRLPMTPGVIPAKRHDLALSIGRMVGDHLLTSEDVRKALGEERFQGELRSLITTRVESFLARDLGTVDSLVPKRFRAYFKAWVKIMRWRTLKHLHDHLDSSAFADSLSAALAERFADLASRPVTELLPPEMLDRFLDFLGDTAGDLMAGPEVGQWLTAYIDKRFNEILDEGRTPADLLPAELTALLLARLEEETPALMEKLAGLIKEPVMKNRLTVALGRVVDNFTSALGPVAGLLGSFLNPATIRARIGDYLEHKGGELSKWLFDEAVQEKVATLLREKGDLLLHTPLAELLKGLDTEKLAGGRTALAAQVLGYLSDPATGRAVANLLRDSFLAQKDRDLDELLTLLLGVGGPAQVRALITAETITMIRSRNFKRLLDRLVTGMIDGQLLANPIGRLDSFLPPEVKSGINDFLLEQTSDILAREVPGLVDSLNINEIVTRKVDSLDLLKLEELLMGIMQEQFKYINLFGALLGFIIGLGNLLFLLGG